MQPTMTKKPYAMAAIFRLRVMAVRLSCAKNSAARDVEAPGQRGPNLIGGQNMSKVAGVAVVPLTSPPRHDLTGQRFERLTVVECAGQKTSNGTRRVIWMCICDCGGRVLRDANTLLAGESPSCGCLHYERIGLAKRTHGQTRTPTHIVWMNMIQRCTNSNRPDWPRYGGAGISVCERWRSYVNFISDMGQRPDGKSIDRINSRGNYEPGNCRWATASEQAKNRKTARLLTDGARTMNLIDWEIELGLYPETIRKRLNAGWSEYDAVTTRSLSPKSKRRVA